MWVTAWGLVILWIITYWSISCFMKHIITISLVHLIPFLKIIVTATTIFTLLNWIMNSIEPLQNLYKLTHLEHFTLIQLHLHFQWRGTVQINPLQSLKMASFSTDLLLSQRLTMCITIEKKSHNGPLEYLPPLTRSRRVLNKGLLATP